MAAGKLLLLLQFLVSASQALKDEVNGIDMGYENFRPTLIPDDKAFIRPKAMYEKCSRNETTCYGVTGTKCVEEKYCDYIFSITEAADQIKWDYVDMYNFGFPLRRELVNARLIALSPFHFDGSSYTCKSSITPADFRIFVYQVQPTVQKRTGGEEFRFYDWTGSYMSQKIDVPAKGFSKTCSAKLKTANEQLGNTRNLERLEVPFHRTSPFLQLKNQELIFVLYYKIDESQGLPSVEMNKFLDINNYNTSDGVVFTNFLNEEQAKKPFQMRSTNTATGFSAAYPVLILVISSLITT